MKYKRFGFNGIQLDIPESWDPARCVGDAVQGSILLDDSDEPQLNVRWNKLGGADKERVEKKVIHAEKSLEIQRHIDLGDRESLYLISSEAGRMAVSVVLQPESNRYVILEVYHPTPDARGFCHNMVAPLLATDSDEVQRWSFFDTQFWLHRDFLLTESDLKVGCFRLEFARKKRLLTLWDFSLLDRIEKRDDMASFARDLVEKQFKKRYSFNLDDVRRGKDAAEMELSVRRRWRWLVMPKELFFGCGKAELYTIANRKSNRLSVLLYQYRKYEDLELLGGLADSLRGAETD